MSPIYITSPKTKTKVLVGWIDGFNNRAIFEITPARYFAEADSIGIDEAVFKRKSVSWCLEFEFRLWNGERYLIRRNDFMDKAWIYPPGNKKGYKAPRDVFAPKLVITRKMAEELDRDYHDRRTGAGKYEEEYLRSLCL